MALDPTEARSLGNIEATLKSHVDQAIIKYEEDREFRQKTYKVLEKLDEKAEKAHKRIDIHETKLSTMKYLAGIIGACISAAYHFLAGGK